MTIFQQINLNINVGEIIDFYFWATKIIVIASMHNVINAPNKELRDIDGFIIVQSVTMICVKIVKKIIINMDKIMT